MPSVARISRPLFRLRASPAVRVQSLHATSFRAALNETDRDRENLHDEIDHHKNDGLQKQKDGKGHWKGELASQSEAALKADRGDIEASEDTINKLQKETEQFANQQHKKGE